MFVVVVVDVVVLEAGTDSGRIVLHNAHCDADHGFTNVQAGQFQTSLNAI